MTGSISLFIEVCWLAWLAYWVAMAFTTKRTLERGGFFGYRLAGAAVVIVCVLAGRLLNVSSHSHVWHTTAALSIVCDAMVLTGAAFTVWARITLGRNWSAEITFKQDHELIESGPYALARHPIYTGLIGAFFALAIQIGLPLGLLGAALIALGFGLKGRIEERFLSAELGEAAYADYRRRVPMLIPFWPMAR